MVGLLQIKAMLWPCPQTPPLTRTADTAPLAPGLATFSRPLRLTYVAQENSLWSPRYIVFHLGMLIVCCLVVHPSAASAGNGQHL